MALHNPEWTLRVVEVQADEDELDAIAAMSEAEVAEALRAEGLDPGAIEDDAEVLARRAVVSRRKGASRPQRRIAWVAWLSAAAALLLALGAIGYTERAAIVAHFRPAPPLIGPDDEEPPAPAPREIAARLRDEAERACASHLWGRCADELDQARGLDPAGDTAERVLRMRAAIGEAKSHPPYDEKVLPRRSP